jgi:Fic family protein
MTYDPRQPFNDLPPLPPTVEVETKAVLKRAAAARVALAELKGAGGTIPNQAMLVNSLVLQEAQASSEVENILTTNDALFRAFAASTGRVDVATKEVLRYRQALWAGYEALRVDVSLTTDVFIHIVQTIKEDGKSIRSEPGTAIFNRVNGAVIYTPPSGESLIRAKLRDLEEFIRSRDDMDPLVKLALVHYQFEAIHPFPDGNGRTGRIINTLFLVLKGLLDLPVLYLSKAIIDKKAAYYRLLGAVTEGGAWEPWTLFMLAAIEETAVFTRERIGAIHELMEATVAEAKQLLPRRVYSKELIELLFNQPYTKAQFLVEAGIARRQTAAEYLRELERVGILRSEKVGRENLYLNKALLGLLSSNVSMASTGSKYASMYGDAIDR